MGCSSSKEGTGTQVVPFLATGGDGTPQLLKAKGAGESSADMPAATTVVLVIGDPASGKTTMCRKLAERNAYAHFVPGDLLREEVEQGTVTGKWANDLMQQGKQVPDQVSVSLLKQAMIAATKHAALSNNVMLVDGFPRTMEQVSLCQQEMGAAHAVVYLEVPEQIARARWVSDGGGEDAFKSVYQKAKKQSQAIKQHYIAQGSCHVVNASQGPNAVFAEIAKLLEELQQRRSADLRAHASSEPHKPRKASNGQFPDDGVRGSARSAEGSPASTPVPGAVQSLSSAGAQLPRSPTLVRARAAGAAVDSPESVGPKDPAAVTPPGGGQRRVSGAGNGLQAKTPVPKRLQPLQAGRKEQSAPGAAMGGGSGGDGEEEAGPPPAARLLWQRPTMAAPQRIAPLKLSMGQHEEVGEVEEKAGGGLSGKRRLDMANLDDRRMLDQLLDHVRNNPSRLNTPHARMSPLLSPHGPRLSPGAPRSMSRQGSIAPGYLHTRFSTPGHIGDDAMEVHSPADRFSTPRPAASRQGSIVRRAGAPALSRQGSVAGAPRVGYGGDHGGSPGRKARASMPGSLVSHQASMRRPSVEMERPRTQAGERPLRKQVSLSTEPLPPSSARTSAPGTMPRSILRKSDPLPAAPLGVDDEVGVYSGRSSPQGGPGSPIKAPQSSASPGKAGGTGGTGGLPPGVTQTSSSSHSTTVGAGKSPKAKPSLLATPPSPTRQGVASQQGAHGRDAGPSPRSPSPLGQRSSVAAPATAAAPSSAAAGAAGAGAATASGARASPKAVAPGEGAAPPPAARASNSGAAATAHAGAAAAGTTTATGARASPKTVPPSAGAAAPPSAARISGSGAAAKLAPLRHASPVRTSGGNSGGGGGGEKVVCDALGASGGGGAAAAALPSVSPRTSQASGPPSTTTTTKARATKAKVAAQGAGMPC